MWTIGPNPMHCFHCNGELEPSGVPLLELVDDVAHWAMLEGAIEHLELDSGPYEQWAQGELLNLQSPVNLEGLALRRSLDRVRHCYLVLFQPMDGSGNFVVPPACPQCGGAWERFSRGRFTRLLCETCGLAVVNR
jgi:predicted  nucleic acid-binding Zn ribbon protein